MRNVWLSKKKVLGRPRQTEVDMATFCSRRSR